MAGQDETRDRDEQTVWLKAKTEGLICLLMIFDTTIKRIPKSRERAVVSREAKTFHSPGGLRFSESFGILPSSGTVRHCNLLDLGPQPY